MARKKDKKYDIISRSNILINSSYKSTLLENKLTVLALKNAKEGDGKLEVSFSTDQLRHLTGVKGNGLYTTLQRAATGMIGRTVFIQNEQEQYFDYINLIQRCRFEDGEFTVTFSDETKELIYNLPNNFTQMSIGTLFSFRSNYAYRLYELLKTREYQLRPGKAIEVEYGLSDFKLKMNCIDTSDKRIRQELSKKEPDLDKIVNELSKDAKNKRWSNFKTKVVDVAVEELNNNDLVEFTVDYEPVKSGRGGKVVGIRFVIFNKDSASKRTSKIEVAEVLEIMKPNEISEADVLAIIAEADGDIGKIKSAYELAKKQIYIDNLVAWMIACIKNGYEEESIPMAAGDSEKGQQIKDLKDDMNDEETRKIIAEEVWESAKLKEGFELFVAYLERSGIDFRMFEMIYDAADKYKQYIDWKLGRHL